MYQAFILVCLVGVAPGNCELDMAVAFFQAPRLVSSQLMCGLQAKAFMDDVKLKPNDGEYFRVSCLPAVETAAK